jgi:acyl-coenzyme A thioesterase PaaI-like protein
VLDDDESFLTADLRVEFVRSARPGVLRAKGVVVQRNRGVAFCAADLYDGERTLLASSRCTQIIRRD